MKRFTPLLLLLLAACTKKFEAPVPLPDWPLFDDPAAVRLTSATRTAAQGVFTVNEGTGHFGAQMVLHSSYRINGTDTSYHLSLFGEKDISWIILEGKRLGDSILLRGYWRKMINTETGRVQLVIPANSGALLLFAPAPQPGPGSVQLRGVFGNGSEIPGQALALTYLRPLRQGPPFEILAHRSGGRTSDLLPHSENSVNMIRFASQLGATGIEIDVRLTRDGVPILYHDNTLNLRLIQKNGLVGPIEDYSYDQLYRQVRLLDGQRIPTLREALYAVVYETDLRTVWLDTKYDGPLDRVQALQAEFLQRATQIGRQVQIYIGLPNDDAFNRFRQLPNFSSTPSLCELSIDKVNEINARVWAPRWTLGLQGSEVSAVQATGRKVFVWTLDVPEYLRQFVNEGNFDGILTNYPSLLAYHHYVKQ